MLYQCGYNWKPLDMQVCHLQQMPAPVPYASESTASAATDFASETLQGVAETLPNRRVAGPQKTSLCDVCGVPGPTPSSNNWWQHQQHLAAIKAAEAAQRAMPRNREAPEAAEAAGSTETTPRMYGKRDTRRLSLYRLVGVNANKHHATAPSQHALARKANVDQQQKAVGDNANWHHATAASQCALARKANVDQQQKTVGDNANWHHATAASQCALARKANAEQQQKTVGDNVNKRHATAPSQHALAEKMNVEQQQKMQAQEQGEAWGDDANVDEPPPPVPTVSIGSVGHPFSCAGACKFVRRKRGCKDGSNCDRCHICVWRSRASVPR
jgi:hypothetical protein